MREEDEDLRTLERHAAQLSEHFASVRIIATMHDGNTTHSVSFGLGNFHAQMGSVREWMMRQEEQVRLEERNKYNRENDDV